MRTSFFGCIAICRMKMCWKQESYDASTNNLLPTKHQMTKAWRFRFGILSFFCAIVRIGNDTGLLAGGRSVLATICKPSLVLYCSIVGHYTRSNNRYSANCDLTIFLLYKNVRNVKIRGIFWRFVIWQFVGNKFNNSDNFLTHRNLANRTFWDQKYFSE